MSKLFCSFIFAASVLSTTSFAIPPNFYTEQQQLIQYHNSGAYQYDLQQVTAQAKQYLSQRLATPHKKNNLAIMLDVDETSLSNFAAIKIFYNSVSNVGDTLNKKDLKILTDPFHASAIGPTLSLYRYALKNHVAVFFVTGRTENDRAGTVRNLKHVGFNKWQALTLRQPNQAHVPAKIYKANAAADIKKQGYDIVFAMGDQYSDLPQQYADKVYKLPNPFYFIP